MSNFPDGYTRKRSLTFIKQKFWKMPSKQILWQNIIEHS